jgi:hypothetical protein
LSEAADPLVVTMPTVPGVAVLAATLEDGTGRILGRNFTTFVVKGASELGDGLGVRAIRFSPASFRAQEWSLKQWNVLDGLKVNGAGCGFFEYRLPWPADLDPAAIQEASFVVEASAKQLLGKDREGAATIDGDYMLGKGTVDPSRNPNAYPMTDTTLFPSAVRIRVAGRAVGTFDLPDDPADHRGILSWHAQRQDKKLREAGSYGYLLQAGIPREAIERAAAAKEIVIRLEVDPGLPGGLAIYGERFGRYPVDPTVIFRLK